MFRFVFNCFKFICKVYCISRNPYINQWVSQIGLRYIHVMLIYILLEFQGEIYILTTYSVFDIHCDNVIWFVFQAFAPF